VPAATTIAVLLNPTSRFAGSPPSDLQAAAHAMGLQLQVVQASSDREVEAALASVARMRPRALMIPTDAFFLDRRAQLGALTLHHEIPPIHSYREFAAAGGLMAYGGSRLEEGRQVGVYAGRALKGEKDLPVYQGTKVELIINLKTAKALGITVPQLLLGRADEVIE
jgi:ABC-type uncharacterized transport system substrate-binding protein